MVSLGGRLLVLGGGDGEVFLGSGEELVGGRWGPGLLFSLSNCNPQPSTFKVEGTRAETIVPKVGILRD